MRSMTFIGILMMVWFAMCSRNEQEFQTKAPIPVQVTAAKRSLYSKPVHTSGRLRSSAQMKLSFKIGGIVDRMYVKPGETVQAGQLLAALKPDEIKGQVRQAKVGLEKAERDFERVRNLYADTVATLEQMQNAESALALAESRFEIALFNQKHAVIRAPEAGQILMQPAEVNELVGPGQPVLVFGSLQADWRVTFGVTDRDVVRLNLKDSARVRLDAYPNTVFRGEIDEISGAPNPANGMFTVEAAIASSDLLLKNGLTGRVMLFPAQKDTLVALPFAALVEAEANAGYVYVIQSDSLARRRAVEIAALSGDGVFIRKGLAPGERVVTRGAAYLSDGDPILIKETMP